MFSHMYHKLHHKFKLVLKLVVDDSAVSVLCSVFWWLYLDVVHCTRFDCDSILISLLLENHHAQLQQLHSFWSNVNILDQFRDFYWSYFNWFSSDGLNCQTILNDLVASLTAIDIDLCMCLKTWKHSLFLFVFEMFEGCCGQTISGISIWHLSRS